MTFNTFEGHKIFVTAFCKGSLFSDGSNYLRPLNNFHNVGSFVFFIYIHFILYFSFCNSASFFFFFNLFDLVWFDAMNLEHDTSVLTHIWLCNYVVISREKFLNEQVSDLKPQFEHLQYFIFSFFAYLLFQKPLEKSFLLKITIAFLFCLH